MREVRVTDAARGLYAPDTIGRALEVFTAWTTDAACLDMDVDVFFAPERVPEKSYYEQARTVCGSCPVREKCLDFFISETVGFFGGMSPSERAAERDRRGVQPKALTAPGGPERVVLDPFCEEHQVFKEPSGCRECIAARRENWSMSW